MKRTVFILWLATGVSGHLFGQQPGDIYDNFNQKPNPNQAYFVIKSPVNGKEYYSGRLIDHKCSECYDDITAIGDSLYARKNFADALSLYAAAFSLNNDRGKVKHRYKAACAWVMMGNPDQAFDQLNRLVRVGKYDHIYEISTDKCFQPLHKDKRWEPLLEAVRENARQVQEKLKKEMKEDG
jgi:tetratricopeptide (TPR) repeat protein